MINQVHDKFPCLLLTVAFVAHKANLCPHGSNKRLAMKGGHLCNGKGRSCGGKSVDIPRAANIISSLNLEITSGNVCGNIRRYKAIFITERIYKFIRLNGAFVCQTNVRNVIGTIFVLKNIAAARPYKSEIIVNAGSIELNSANLRRTCNQFFPRCRYLIYQIGIVEEGGRFNRKRRGIADTADVARLNCRISKILVCVKVCGNFCRQTCVDIIGKLVIGDSHNRIGTILALDCLRKFLDGRRLMNHFHLISIGSPPLVRIGLNGFCLYTHVGPDGQRRIRFFGGTASG